MQGCSYEWKGNGIRLDLNRSLAGGGGHQYLIEELIAFCILGQSILNKTILFVGIHHNVILSTRHELL